MSCKKLIIFKHSVKDIDHVICRKRQTLKFLIAEYARPTVKNYVLNLFTVIG